jgi:hypothetical protein
MVVSFEGEDGATRYRGTATCQECGHSASVIPPEIGPGKRFRGYVLDRPACEHFPKDWYAGWVSRQGGVMTLTLPTQQKTPAAFHEG